MDNSLDVQNLCYLDILKNISFTLKDKTFNALVGRNGSGKSTLIKCLLGLFNYNGEVLYKNKKVDKIFNKIGYIYPDMFIEEGLVIDKIIEPITTLGTNKKNIKDKTFKIAKKLGIEYSLYKNTSELSKIEYKLINLISQTILDPEYIFIDEDYSDLPFEILEKVNSYIKKLSKSSIVLMTVLDEKYLMDASSILFIDNGELIGEGNISKYMENEKIFSKCNIKMPFILDISSKLKSYNLIDQVYTDKIELVDSIWK